MRHFVSTTAKGCFSQWQKTGFLVRCGVSMMVGSTLEQIFAPGTGTLTFGCFLGFWILLIGAILNLVPGRKTV